MTTSFVPTSIIWLTASILLVETTLRSVSTPSTKTTCSTVVTLPSLPSWTIFSVPLSRSALSRRIVLYALTSTLVSSFSTTIGFGFSISLDFVDSTAVIAAVKSLTAWSTLGWSDLESVLTASAFAFSFAKRTSAFS